MSISYSPEEIAKRNKERAIDRAMFHLYCVLVELLGEQYCEELGKNGYNDHIDFWKKVMWLKEKRIRYDTSV